MSADAVVAGVRATTLAALCAAASRAGAGEGFIVCDATFGSWRARHLATELRAQLGIPPAGGRDVRAALASRDAAPPLSEMIGAGIDAEARGDETMRLALEDAHAIAGAAPFHCSGILLLAPARGYRLSLGDERFVGLLGDALKGVPLLMAITDDEPPPQCSSFRVRMLEDSDAAIAPEPPRICSGSLIPGIIDAKTAALLATEKSSNLPRTRALPNGCLLVAPEDWPRGAISRAQFDKLGAALKDTWIEPFAQLHGNNLFVDGELLAKHAWLQFSEGAVDIALRFLCHAIECATAPSRRAALEAQAQGMRIAALRFQEAADAPGPADSAPEALRGFLLEAKGWGLAMTGGAAEAVPLLREARSLMEAAGEDGRESLYLMNITALCELRRGAPDMALALEEEIRERAAAFEVEDARLTFVNSINLARLYRRLGDLDRARELYDRAFATSLGARSESDQVYSNAMLAMLAHARARMDEADQSWLRASLHWLACDAPEAIGGRAVAAIAPSSAATEDVVERVSAAILGRWRECGRSPAAGAGGGSLRFAKADVETRCERVVAGEGWMIGLAVARPQTIERRRGPFFEELRALVSRRMIEASPPMFEGFQVAIVDDRFGQTIGASFADVIEACVRLETQRLWTNDGAIELSREVRRGLRQRSRLALGPAVAAIRREEGGFRARFRRYLPPILLQGPFAEVAEAAILGSRIDELSVDGSTADAVTTLRAARVIDVHLTEEACAEVGIKLPSSATSAPF